MVGYCRGVTKNPWNARPQDGEGAEPALPRTERRGDAYFRQGRLSDAEQAFVEDKAYGRALEMTLVQADVETEPRARLAHLARAKHHAERGTNPAGRREVELRYHRTRQALLEATPAGATKRAELAEIGRAFEALEALDEAAHAFRLAGDHASLARVLTAAGDVEALEEALRGQERAEQTVRAFAETRARANHLAATGQREDAIRLLRTTLRATLDPELARLEAALIDARATPQRTTLITANGPGALAVFGDEIVIGRGEGAHIVIASPVISRRHLLLRRDARGEPCVDVVGRGTLLGGAIVSGELSVQGHLELALGGVRCALDRDADGGLVVETGGKRYGVPLGPLSIGPFVIVPRDEGLRLTSRVAGTHPHLDGVTACPEGIDLARGDRVSAERNGPFVVQVAR